jgi:hypothetical protein
MTVAIFAPLGFEIFFQLRHVGSTTGGRGIAAIGDGVDHEVFDAGGLGGIAQRGEVILMRMHTAIADEAEKVEALAFGLLEGFDQHGHGGEFAIADAFVDAGEVLIHHAAGTEIEMADFTIAHLAVWQADVFAAGTDGAAWIGGVEVIVERGLRQQGGVAIGGGLSFTAGIDAPAVADDENYRFFGHGLGGQWVKFASRSRRLRRQNGSRSTLLTTLPST